MHNGAVFVGRLVSDKALNSAFVPDSGEMTTVYQSDAPVLKAELQNGTIVYRSANEQMPESLGPDEVEVHVAAMGLSASDGADDVPFLSHEMVGTVTRVGSDVIHVTPGTHVMGFALDQLSTFQRTSSSLVQPLSGGSSLIEAASLPSAFVTAIYGLEELARTQPGDNIVIVDNMGGVGQAAAQLCRVLGANAIVVTSSAATEEYLRGSGQHSISSVVPGHNGSISSQLRIATGRRGIDVVFCAAAGDEGMIIECSRLLAPFGRIVMLGSAGDCRQLSSHLPSSSPGLSLFQFDLPNIIKHRARAIAP